MHDATREGLKIVLRSKKNHRDMAIEDLTRAKRDVDRYTKTVNEYESAIEAIESDLIG